MFGSILSKKNLVVRRTTRPQFLVVLTYFLVAEDARTLEFCYPRRYTFGTLAQKFQGKSPLKRLYVVYERCIIKVKYHFSV